MAHLARQVRVPAGELATFDFAGRSAQRFRGEIRAYTGYGQDKAEKSIGTAERR